MRPLSQARGPATATVLVAVSAAPMREALSAMIGALPGFEVVAEVGTDQAALDAARAWRPTLALVDQDGPGCCGAWTMQSLLRDGLVRAIIGIGLRADGARRAAAAGALAYVQIGASPQEVCEALRTALLGASARQADRPRRRPDRPRWSRVPAPAT